MPKGGILADEVGLGKTIMTIATMIGNYKERTLIVLPKSLVLQWKSQIEQFTDFIKPYVIDNKSKIKWKDHGVYLMSHNQLIRDRSYVHDVRWDRVIIDEAHILRNGRTKFCKACDVLESDIRWALTATPVMNRMSDFVNIMKWIGVSQFLCQGEKDTVASTFILRRTKEDMQLNTLPPCTVNIVYTPFHSPEELKLYLRVFHKERNMIIRKNKRNVPDLLEHLLRIRQICINPQLYLYGMTMKTKENHGIWNDSITKHDKLIDAFDKVPLNDKCIVFCQFVHEITFYQDLFKNKQVRSVRLDGRMSLLERKRTIQSFEEDPNIRLFFIQIDTGGQGINLQVANHIFIMSPNWNPAIEHQAIGRAYRTGQTKPVYVTKFCVSSMNETIPFVEENIIKLQNTKKKIISSILRDTRIENDGITTEVQCNNVALTSKDILQLFNIYHQT